MTDIGDSIVYTVAIPSDADPTQLNFWLREAIDGTEFEWTYANVPVEGTHYPTGANPITRSSAGHYRLVWVARKAERIVGVWEASGSVNYTTQSTTFVRHSDVRAIDDSTGANVQPGTGVAGSSSGRHAGEYYVDDYGAVAVALTSGWDQTNDDLRTANTVAIQAALDTARAAGGGTVFLGAGIYITNAAVGFNLSTDENVGVMVQGLAGVSMIASTNYTEPAMWFHTTGGNLRELVVQDIILRGGREGLSLFWVAYSNFNRVWFWGSKQWGLQDDFGNGNWFHECRFNEGAQGISTGVEADAAFFNGCEETLSQCNLGEYAGGILVTNGIVSINQCLFHDCQLRGAPVFNYEDDTNTVLGGGELVAKPSAITGYSGGSVLVSGCTGSTTARFILAFRLDELIVSGCRIQGVAGGSPGFQGMVETYAGGGTTPALHLTGSTFTFHVSGFFVKDDAELHDSAVQAQVITYSPATMTALSSSAPKLLNPSGENNWLQLNTYAR